NIDLSAWNSNKIIDLDGEWEFFNHSLAEDISGVGTIVSIPHYWANNPLYGNKPYGYATYRLTITGLTEEKVYGVSLIDAGISYTLRVNGNVIMNNGVVSRTRENYVPYSKSEVGYFSPDDDGVAIITMEISNFDNHEAGFWLPLSISSGAKLFSYEINHYILTSFLFGIIIANGVYFVILHMLSRREYKAFYLGLFSFLLAMRLIITGHRLILFILPFLSWYTIVRLEYILGMLILPVIGLFLSRLQFIPIKRHLEYFYFGLAITLIVVGMLVPVRNLEDMFTLFKFLFIGFVPFFIYTLAFGLIHKARGSVLMMFSAIIMIFATLLEFFFGGSLYNFLFASLVMIAFMSVAIADEFLNFKAFSKSLETEIVIDPLTSVYNRLYLNKLIENEKKGISPLDGYFYLLFMDLDNFKFTNDTYGHAIGDEILCVISERMRTFFGENSIIIRYGGDEFIILHRATSGIEIENVIQSFKKVLEHEILLNGKTYTVTGSIGHSAYHSKEHSLEDAIKTSDMQMYQKKQFTYSKET
ncbi:MAG: diguanylate cyclase, partial [Acholeplasmataceae bacterium]|nr:diguanylate cyclase [Acholeplasmataceae bacterium]